MTDSSSKTPPEIELSALLQEQRRFPPAPDFRRGAHVASADVYAEAERDFEAYWAEHARALDWFSPWGRVLDWAPPFAKWFAGGKLNASFNCVDRHLRTWRRNKAAIIWEGEDGAIRTLTYRDLFREVNAAAAALLSLGVKKGDRVAIYLPMVPEAAVAMLACARIGAIHSVVFGGFSAESLRDRINDAGAVVLITADGGYRRGQIVPLKKLADEALDEEGGCPSIRHVVVVKRGGDVFPVNICDGRDHWWHRICSQPPGSAEAGSVHLVPPVPCDAEDPLFILYTSGTTGKPKGILHTTGGYLTGVHATTKWIFDLKDEDVFWCTADIGWVTGHSYVVYGPLALGATIVMYEGSPDWPKRDRFWSIIEKHGVTVFYTAPTAIRAFMKWGKEWPDRHDLTSLRLLGSVGEPINPEAWMWYRDEIGGGRCPVVDTWWQTETGHIMISPLPGVTTTKPGSASRAFPGISAEIRNAAGDKVEKGGGYLAISRPWPGMLRGIWGDEDRYRKTYWSKWDGVYFPGDGAKLDDDGDFWLLGRVDDVLNVGGHRIGTMEVESALVSHSSVAEAAVVGIAHEIKGQAIAAFVVLREGKAASDGLIGELREHVTSKIGAIAKPEKILFAPDLPKTRSGKIMRRLLRDVAEGRALGDTTTLADPNVVERLREKYGEEEG